MNTIEEKMAHYKRYLEQEKLDDFTDRIKNAKPQMTLNDIVKPSRKLEVEEKKEDPIAKEFKKLQEEKKKKLQKRFSEHLKADYKGFTMK